MPWDEIQHKYHELARSWPGNRFFAEIVDSVVSCARTEELAAYPALDGLRVARRPLVEPPVDLVLVNPSTPYLHPILREGFVRIEHLATMGHDEVVDAPVADAVALFWRFMIEKFGVDPGRNGR